MFRAEWNERIHQLEMCSSIEERDRQIELISQMPPSNFETYFEKNWLCLGWLNAWISCGRPHRFGLWNTNNFTEAQFKRIVKVFSHRIL